MRLVAELLRLSATDLANHLGCVHLSQLDLAVAEGRAKRPHRNDPIVELLTERGREHEAAYLKHLRAQKLVVAEIRIPPGSDNVEATLAAMRDGADVIYQAPLADERWQGRADFLRKVAAPSALGDWSYEVTDAKLATETRAGTILQLCVYSTLLEQLQGRKPEAAHVVAPHHHFVPESYRLADYDAYYRLVKKRLETALAARDAITYPEPAQHCDVCNWWSQCNARRRADDHLTFVAGISRLQIKELRTRLNVDTLERLGDLKDIEKPKRGSREALERTRDQAAIQLKARRMQGRQHEVLPLGPEHGFLRLPEPARGDLFLDLEGDRLALDGGREYLFGVSDTRDGYTPLWATNPAEEKRAFEDVVDRILAAFRADRAMHVYHFGAYEPTSFKRLSGRYATRENELDTILRAELFVDLHTIVRHSLRASVETYSLKDLEQFYGLVREQDLRIATASRRALEWAIEMREDLGLSARDRCEAGCGQAAARARPRCRARREQVRRAHRRRRALQPRRLRVRGAVARLARAAARRSRARQRRRAAAPGAPLGRGQRASRRGRGGNAARDGRAARGADAGRRRRAQRRATGALAHGAAARVASPRGEGRVVGVLSAARSAARGLRGRALGAGGARVPGDASAARRASPSIATCSRRKSTTCAAATRCACPSPANRSARSPASTSPRTRSTSSTRGASRTCGPSASSSGAWCRRSRSRACCSRSVAGSRPTASTPRDRIALRATCC